ncbi:hypothetical protein BJ166DRAFT_594667 [Pestalotiopsis sp. NC0098]|nr:hypothetical protein BJ166DRAFT_594667 [Pestalotiopsis sp. NC0098]
MAPPDIVPMDVDGNPELSKEVMDVAGSIIQEFNLGVADIFALADTLDQFKVKDSQDKLEIKNREDKPVTEDLEHEPKAKKMKALENPAPESELVFLNHYGEPEIDDPEGVNTNWEMMYPMVRDDPSIDKSEPLVPFPDICEYMCDLDRELPDWLTSPANRAQNYTDKQFFVISVMAEARYWVGEAKNSNEQLKAWQIVFGLPRNVHAQMMNKSDAITISKWKNIAMNDCSFADGIPWYFFEDMPDSYKQLRDTYFPNGIDDALPVYFKHMKDGEVIVAHLRRRMSWLAQTCPGMMDTTLFKESHTVLFEMSKTLLKNYHMSEKWNNFTKSQKQYYQLPGVDHGLAYGEQFHIQFDSNKPWLMVHPQGQQRPFWQQLDSDSTHVRWQVGSAWMDYLRNIRQDHPILRTFDQKDLEFPLVHHTEENPGPMEMRMPPVLLKMAKKYIKLQFECCVSETSFTEPSEKEAAAVGQRLAKGTGENWLIPGRWDAKRTTMLLRVVFPNKPVIEGRPRYDGFGNLRCDYISAILRELRNGKWTSRYKKYLKATVWKGGGCDDDTPLGYDLTWPELPKHVVPWWLNLQSQDRDDVTVSSFDGLESGDEEMGSEFDSDETEVKDGAVEDGDETEVEEDHVVDGNSEDGNETKVEDHHAEDSHVEDNHIDETHVEDRDVMNIDE